MSTIAVTRLPVYNCMITNVSLIWSSPPPDWPAYTDLTGHEWRLASNGYWWLRHGGAWHQAGSQDADDVLGVRVPPAILRRNQHWLMPQQVTRTPDTAWPRTHIEQQITSAFGVPSVFVDCGGGGGGTSITFASGTSVLRTAPINADPAPNVPPDFAEIPLGSDCCQECHLNDGPLYKGGLCRYCWMLAQLPPATPQPWVHWPSRRTLVHAASCLVTLVVLYVLVYVIARAIG